MADAKKEPGPLCGPGRKGQTSEVQGGRAASVPDARVRRLGRSQTMSPGSRLVKHVDAM